MLDAAPANLDIVARSLSEQGRLCANKLCKCRVAQLDHRCQDGWRKIEHGAIGQNQRKLFSSAFSLSSARSAMFLEPSHRGQPRSKAMCKKRHPNDEYDAKDGDDDEDEDASGDDVTLCELCQYMCALGHFK